MLTFTLYERLNKPQSARALAQANLLLLDRWWASYGRFPSLPAYRAVALAQLGRRDEAIKQIEQAVQVSPRDSFDGPRVLEVQAMVNTRLGFHAEAISQLTRLLSSNYRDAITVADLRLNPVWDPLRGDTEFEKLILRENLHPGTKNIPGAAESLLKKYR